MSLGAAGLVVLEEGDDPVDELRGDLRGKLWR